MVTNQSMVLKKKKINKKKVFIAILIVFFIVTGSWISYMHFIKKEKDNTKMQENKTPENKTEQEVQNNEENQMETIKIYDIEEGYLTVSYNRNVKKHKYNWEHLKKDEKGYYIYQDDNYETKLGIDVSTYQGEIDWKQVKKAGIEFAILRLGFRGYGKEGKLILDDRFEENIKKATKEGIKVGVYFFSQAINSKEAIEEAKYVLKQIEGKKINYPICFDLEKIKFDTARTDNLTKEEITQITLAFCRQIEKAGYLPCIYGNAKFFTTKIELEKVDQYQKWYADYQEQPLYPYDFSIWQYTEKGKIPGIKGKVDINLQFISLK